MRIDSRNAIVGLIGGLLAVVLLVLFLTPQAKSKPFLASDWRRSDSRSKDASLYVRRGEMIETLCTELQRFRMSHLRLRQLLGKPDGETMTRLDYRYEYNSESPTEYFLRINFTRSGEFRSVTLEIEP